LPGLAQPAGAQARPPSFLVVVTDDMRAADWEALPQTRALLAARGTRFDNFCVTTSLCCPSRASILTGQYTHNHGVTATWKQFERNGLGSKTIAVALNDAGYRTALIGKYLNEFPEQGHKPPGWDRFVGYSNGSYSSLVLNENGSRHEYGEKRYELDILASNAQDFLRRVGADEPFFLYFAPKAPHVPATPPKRARNALPDAAVARTPDFNEADVSDKPQYIRRLRPINSGKYDGLHRKRLRTLLAVDDAIAGLWTTLEEAGRLDDTYIFVLSDNGYTIGQHRRVGKTAPYDGSVRIPMYAYGPGFAAGSEDGRLVANIDIAPTIAAAAGVALSLADGFSLLQPTTRDALLLEWRFSPEAVAEDVTAEGQGKGHKGKGKRRRRDPSRWSTGEAPDYLGLRTLDTLYVVYRTGERELYDYTADPYELDNLLADWSGHTPTAEAAARAASLAARLDALRDCAGATCR
jgi:arylsulfatase A-like enzyme